MVMHQPTYCCPHAFQLFATQVPVLNTTAGLFKAALAVSMHALDDVSYRDYAERIDELGKRVLSEVRSDHPQAVMAHLHQVLFEEEQFCGNWDDYYTPLNSYLPVVFETRRGIPVTLTLIYKLVAQRVGIEVQGLNTPGHFLALVHDGGRHNQCPTIVDPFAGGRVLTLEEVRSQVATITSRRYSDDVLLRPATHHDWLRRIITNLRNIFGVAGHEADLAAMSELHHALQPC